MIEVVAKRIAVYSKLVLAVQGLEDHRRISRRRAMLWDQKSAKEQKEYLDEHPNSIYHKLGITKKESESPDENTEDTDENIDENTENIDENTDENTDENIDENIENIDENIDENTENIDENIDENTENIDENTENIDENIDENIEEDPVADLTDEERETANSNIDSLEEEDLTPGSSKRYAMGDYIYENGEEQLNNEFDDDELKKLSKDLEKMRLQNDIAEEKKRADLINGVGGKSAMTKRVATTVGMLLLASAIGVGLYAINPYLGLQLGAYMMENFASIHSNIMGRMGDKDFTLSAVEDDKELKAFIEAVSTLAKEGNLPEDFADVCRLAIGEKEKNNV